VRVVSLLPAATEIVAALGELRSLVGVTHECDWPTTVRALPRVTRSAVDAAAAPAVVDAQVRAISGSGGAMFDLLADEISALRPDLLVTQALCDVCAVSETDVRSLAGTLRPPPAVVTLGGTSLDGVYDDIARVGAALDAVIGRRPISDELPRIKTPTLVLHGDEDRAIVMPRALAMARAIDGARLVVIPRAGHTSSVEAPEAITRELGAFFEAHA